LGNVTLTAGTASTVLVRGDTNLASLIAVNLNREAGATVHFVDADLDAGPIVMQAAVPVLDDDTEETLSARILAEEHRLYPAAVQLVLDGRWRIEGRRVVS